MNLLFDTSVWVDHFRNPVAALIEAIGDGTARMHPYVAGELAAGNFPDWDRAMAYLRSLPAVRPVSEDRYFVTVRDHGLMGTGLSFVDIHLLAATLATQETQLITRDKRLADQAVRLGCGAQ